MDKKLHYLFDPLCGWCYGAAPTLRGLSRMSGITLDLLPTGLFSGAGARLMTDDFATHAWSNDQRIEHLTGQRFTPVYRAKVLGHRERLFDSGPATLALTAVHVTAPAHEFEALEAIQHARYVDARDVTSSATLVTLLETLGLAEAASRLARADAGLLDANTARTHQARTLMQEFGARGVPTLIAEAGAKRWHVDAGALYADPSMLASELERA
ncbi:DsbA family protein (plasmid) [Comamonadaceae bacterium OTU4NAUVB1]|nr:DsbA family protein [Comamonadaceae bacterium OTU4NAUVB1]